VVTTLGRETAQSLQAIEKLVGGFSPTHLKKYAQSSNWIFPQICRVKIPKKDVKPAPRKTINVIVDRATPKNPKTICPALLCTSTLQSFDPTL